MSPWARDSMSCIDWRLLIPFPMRRLLYTARPFIPARVSPTGLQSRLLKIGPYPYMRPLATTQSHSLTPRGPCQAVLAWHVIRIAHFGRSYKTRRKRRGQACWVSRTGVGQIQSFCVSLRPSTGIVLLNPSGQSTAPTAIGRPTITPGFACKWWWWNYTRTFIVY